MRDGPLYRKIVRKTWRKARFRGLSPLKKTLLMYLWTGPEAINPGIYFIGVPTIADDLTISAKKVRELVRELAADSWFEYDFEARVIFFPKWVEYDPPANPSVVVSYLNQLPELPSSELTAHYAATLKPFIEKHGCQIPESCTAFFSQESEHGVEHGVEHGADTVLGTGPSSYPPTVNKNSEQEQEMSNLERFDDSVLALAELLRDRIMANKPDRIQPAVRGQPWLEKTIDAIDRLVRLDKRSPEQIRAVIEFCQADNEPRGGNGFYWAKNILSGAKLREKFEKLEQDMQDSSKVRRTCQSTRGW